MREPAFWWEPPGLSAWLLSPLALLYGAVARWRMNRAGAQAGVPVICVGNFTLGGAGKTPTAIAITKRLIAAGEKPFFLSRGYGGSLPGPLQVDPAQHKATEVGDEPLLLARTAPVIVSRDRPRGAALAKALGATVIVMDDGLQNPSLAKDLSIAVVDARRGFGNGFVFPAGPLRAPLDAQRRKVQALLLIGDGADAEQAEQFAHGNDCLLLRARLAPDLGTIETLQRRALYAFAGIGDPVKFFATLSDSGLQTRMQESFADHHPYTEAEARRILERCERDRLVPVTTEKDLARIAYGEGALATLARAAVAVPVSLVFEEETALDALLRDRLSYSGESCDGS